MNNTYSHKILLISEDEKLRDLFEQVTSDAKSSLFFESSAEEGIKKLQQKALTFALIVSEQKLNEMQGYEFLEKTAAVSPDSIRFLILREENWDDIKSAINHGQVHRILKAPWNKANLSEPIHWGLQQFDLAMEQINQIKVAKIKNGKLHVLKKDMQKKIRAGKGLIENLNSQIIDLSKNIEESTASEESILIQAYESIDQILKKSGMSEISQKDLNRLYINILNEIIAQMKGFSNQNKIKIDLPILWNEND